MTNRSNGKILRIFRVGNATQLAVLFNWADGSSPLQVTMIRMFGVGGEYIHRVLQTWGIFTPKR